MAHLVALVLPSGSCAGQSVRREGPVNGREIRFRATRKAEVFYARLKNCGDLACNGRRHHRAPMPYISGKSRPAELRGDIRSEPLAA
jgi:hypothetical protein